MPTKHYSVIEHSNWVFWLISSDTAMLNWMMVNPFVRLSRFEKTTNRFVVSGNFRAWRDSLLAGVVPYPAEVLEPLRAAAPDVFYDLPDYPTHAGRANCVSLGSNPVPGYSAYYLPPETRLTHTRMCFEVVTSRALSCQVHRHRAFSVSQRSQRYIDEGKGEADFVMPLGLDNDERMALSVCCLEGLQNYRELRDGTLGKLKKEDARYVLPPAIKSVQIVTANLDGLRHFFEERALTVRAQHETRQVAQDMLEIAYGRYPELFADQYERFRSDETLLVAA